MRFLVLSISLWICCSSFALAISKEELRQQTEVFIRAEQERKRRLESSEVLDDAAKIYYDGNRTYPGIVIEGAIYPAVLRNGYRHPACLVKGELLQGDYDKKTKKVVCQLRTKKVSSSVERAEEKSKKPHRSSVKNKKLEKKSVDKKQKNTKVANNVIEINAFKETEKFGIRAGTWARVYLSRPVSSSESSDIELELLEDVVGRYKTLPGGTIFFTRHRVNLATQRLDMEVILMVLPDGEELQVSATIHGSGRTAGLAGAVLTHSERVAQSSAGRNILGGTQDVFTEISNPFTSIAGDIANDVVDSKKNALPPAPYISVQVSPQEGLIRFRRTF